MDGVDALGGDAQVGDDVALLASESVSTASARRAVRLTSQV